MDKQTILSNYFGHTSFRSGQETIVDCISQQKRDVLCVMPTGGGKSLCYQLSGMLMPGITLVISPLISLMKDQVMSLKEIGIPAAYLNSSLTIAQQNKAIANALNGMYKIIYVAPERLESEAFVSLMRQLDVSLLAVDEAHCVSQWGQDFRPSYLRITDFVAALEKRPVISAFTATATDRVKSDIVRLLQLNEPYIMTTGFDRPNLRFEVIPVQTREKDGILLELLNKRRSSSGIIYCSTRREVERLCQLLHSNGYASVRYHAGLDESERAINQEDFVYDRATVMVATNAFGMGIDKSNVSYVIHYNMPGDIESYYQEAGRAGRDGSDADCILLYSKKDYGTQKFLIENGDTNDLLTETEQQLVKQNSINRLHIMLDYCNTTDCLRGYILRYFGEKTDSWCGNCSNCTGIAKDMSTESQKILSCIVRTGGIYSAGDIIGILRGVGHEKESGLSVYGICSECSPVYLDGIISYLVKCGYIRQNNGVLCVGNGYRDILRGNKRVIIPHSDNIQTLQNSRTAINRLLPKRNPLNEEDYGLFEELKKLRRKITLKESVPAYVIFSDATLREMCAVKPTDTEQFMKINGIGKTKSQKYGEAFIECISKYINNNK